MYFIGNNNSSDTGSRDSYAFGFNNYIKGAREQFALGSNLTTSGDQTVDIGTQDSTKITIDSL